MTTRTCAWIVLTGLLIGCGTTEDDKPEDPGVGAVTPDLNTGTGTGGGNGGGGGEIPASVPLYVSDRPDYGDDSVPEYLDQGWDHDTRMQWWYTSQGSRVLPYNWYLALEMHDSENPLNSSENMQRLRFVEWPADEDWNPDGLPIGFARDIDTETGVTYFGFTCAACHTGMIERDGRQWIIEGGPAHSEFNQFVTEIGDGLKATLDDEAKFARFAAKVLGDDSEQSVIDGLKKDLAVTEANLGARIKANEPPHPNGYGRLDAFGNIFNEGSVFAIGEPQNVKPSDAPVSYPVLWDTPQHEIVQWNGAAVNAGIGPYTRNIGEVVGVFGDLRVEKYTTPVLGTEKLRYKHHIDVAALEDLEAILETLWSPQWPEDVLGKLDAARIERGKAHYENQCINCHAVIADRTDPERFIGEKMIPASATGTDPLAASNPLDSRSKTGLLEDMTVLPLLKVLPAKGLLGGKFEEEADTAKVVGNGVIGVLREERPKKLITGLIAYVKAAKANPAKTTPSYKARPLNGIWSSAPFLHNGSVPNLTELLKKPDDRLKSFHVGSWELDTENVGFSTAEGSNTSEFDATIPGNSNFGHDHGTDLSDDEKSDLIEYIKSL